MDTTCLAQGLGGDPPGDHFRDQDNVEKAPENEQQRINSIASSGSVFAIPSSYNGDYSRNVHTESLSQVVLQIIQWETRPRISEGCMKNRESKM